MELQESISGSATEEDSGGFSPNSSVGESISISSTLRDPLSFSMEMPARFFKRFHANSLYLCVMIFLETIMP